MKPIPLPILGIDMLSDETELMAGTARSVVNVDLGTTTIKRRDGYDIVRAADHSLTGIYAFDGRVLMGEGADLVELDTETFNVTSLCDMGSVSPIDFHEYNESLYACGPAALWRIPKGGRAPRAVGVVPPSLPDAVAHGYGTLTRGRYGVAVSLVNDEGEESPAYVLGYLDLAAGLRLVDVPVLPGCKWRVYLTPPNGDVLYLAEEFDALLDQHVVTVYPDGAPCTTLNLSPMPAGDFFRGHAGRTYVAKGDTLWFSEALRPHLMAPRANFIRFEGRICFLEVVAGGAFVGDDAGVWWLAGADPTAWIKRKVSRALALRRSSLLLAGERFGATGDVVLWLSTEGYYLGTADGGVRQLQPGRIAIDAKTEGRSVFVMRDGVKQVITLTASPSATVFGVAVDSATTN